jgi:L-fucose mutarotase
MLKGISPVLSPQLLATLLEMGHGDEIVLADAHFPGETMGQRCIRADGVQITALLDGILPLFELDYYVEAPVIMMAPKQGDVADPSVETSYRAMIDKHAPKTAPIGKIGRFEFYDRAKEAYAVVMTGATQKYANIILKKGVTPVK